MKIALGYKYRPPHLPILDVIKPNSRREGALAQRSGARRASGKMRVPVSGGAVESGVRPEESNPWGRGSSGSYAARWGACAWPLRKEDPGSRSEEAVCVWGGAPCADEREILLLPVDPNGKRRRIQSTGSIRARASPRASRR